MMHWSKASAIGDIPQNGIRSHSATVVGRKIIVFGGCDAKERFSDLLVFDTAVQSWYKPLIPEGSPPGPHRAHTATLVGNRIFVFGGGDGPNYFKDLYILDTKTFVWTKAMVSGQPPGPRRAHTAELIGNKLFIFGGGDGKQALNETFFLDTDQLVWTQAKGRGVIPSRRGYHRSVLIGSNIYVLGGSDGQECFNDVQMLDTNTFIWSKLPIAESSPLLSHTANHLGNYILVHGGHNSTDYINTLHLLDLRTLEWETPPLSGTPPAPRGYHTMSLCGHRLWMIGGYDGTVCFPDVWILDLGVFVTQEMLHD